MAGDPYNIYIIFFHYCCVRGRGPGLVSSLLRSSPRKQQCPHHITNKSLEWNESCYFITKSHCRITGCNESEVSDVQDSNWRSEVSGTKSFNWNYFLRKNGPCEISWQWIDDPESYCLTVMGETESVLKTAWMNSLIWSNRTYTERFDDHKSRPAASFSIINMYAYQHIYTLTHTLTQQGQQEAIGCGRRYFFVIISLRRGRHGKHHPHEQKQSVSSSRCRIHLLRCTEDDLKCIIPSPTRFLVCVYLIISPNNCMNIIKNVTGIVCEGMQKSLNCLGSDVFIICYWQEEELIDWWLTQLLNKMGNGTWRKCKGRSAGRFYSLSTRDKFPFMKFISLLVGGKTKLRWSVSETGVGSCCLLCTSLCIWG